MPVVLGKGVPSFPELAKSLAAATPVIDRYLALRPERARSRHRRRRRRLAGLLAAIGLPAFVVGAVVGAGGDGTEERRASEPTAHELPRGGRELFPDHRVVAFYGAPQDEQLGELGIGPPDEVARRLEAQAQPYDRAARPVLPAFELIATVANADPGADGAYRFRQPARIIRRYLEAARNARALLVLDVQPGRGNFVEEVRLLAPFLREPDVGLALDPEWHVEAPGVPGQEIGSVDAGTVNRISSYLARIVERNDLPEKLMVVHQFTDDMIADRERLTVPPGVALTINVDGFGDQPNKVAKYQDLRARRATGLRAGFKLFYQEDTDLMDPADVMALRPAPDMIVYE